MPQEGIYMGGIIKRNKVKVLIVLLMPVCILAGAAYLQRVRFDSYKIYDVSLGDSAYDSDHKKNYIGNVLKVSFGVIPLEDVRDGVADYVGGRYFQDAETENTGYIVFPCSYSMDELAGIADDIVNNYSFVTYASYVYS